MIQEMADVLWNEKLGNLYYRMGFICDFDYQQAEPGQFVMVRMADGTGPLLRRPFSIHRQIFNGKGFKGIELLYKVVGNCTDKLSHLTTGDKLDLLGPLGRGFRVSPDYQKVYIVAGGIGVAPLVFLALKLKGAGVDPFQCKVFLGGKTKGDLLCSDDFANLGMAVSIITEDGSMGQTGLVTKPFEAAIEKEKPDIIFACGPEGMLASVQHIAKSHRISCQISVETMMACGMGACLGCAIETRKESNTYRHVCMDGPVFDASILA
jgi:dihydroorotate dehydrogenase electron transfer subunit